MKNKQYFRTGNRLPQVALLCLSSLFLMSCADTPPVTSGIGIENIENANEFTKYLKTDNLALYKRVKISDLKSRKTNDFLEVNLALTSTYEKSLKLQYHFNWFDADGFVIESRKSPWKAIELHGMQTTALKGVAPSTRVASFNVYVREVPLKAYEF